MSSYQKTLLLPMFFFVCIFAGFYSGFGILAQDLAQDNNQSVYKSDTSNSTRSQNSFDLDKALPYDLNIDITIRNPRDRDSYKIPPESLIFEPFNNVLLNSQRNKVVEYWLRISKTDGERFTSGDLISFTPNNIQQIDLIDYDDFYGPPLKSLYKNQIERNAKFSKRAMVLELPSDVLKSQAIYLHMWSDKNLEIDLKAWQADDYLRIDKKYNSLFSMIYASLISLVLVNLVFFIGIRDRNYLVYGIFLAGVVICLISNSGKIFEYSAAKWLALTPNRVLSVILITVTFLIGFLQTYLELKKVSYNLYRMTDYLKIMSAILAAVCFGMNPMPAWLPVVITWMGYLAFPLLLIVPFLALQLGAKQGRYILYAMIPVLFALLIKFLDSANIISSTIYTAYAFHIGMVMQAIIMSIGLSDRVVDIRRQRDFAKDAQRQHTLSLEVEKKHSEMLSKVKMNIDVTAEDPEYEIVKGFFEEIRPMFNFHKAAIIYQIDKHMHIQADKEKHQRHFDNFVETYQIEVSRLCHGNEITSIKIGERSYFEKDTKVIIVPVFMRGQEWSGMLLNVDKTRFYTKSENDALHRFATEMIRSVLAVHITDSIREEVRKDPVTNTLNRAAISDELERTIKNLQYSEKPLATALIDLKGFTLINENYGREIGNLCLQYLSAHIIKHTPEGSIIGRLGGDDFLLILDDCSITQAQTICQEIRDSLVTININNISLDMVVDIGITLCHGPFETVRDIMKRLDKGLKQSTEENNVVVVEI